MPFAAFDLHKKMTEAVVLGDDGSIRHRERFPSTRECFLAFAQKQLGADTVLAMEATFNTWPVVALLKPFVKRVVVSNPMQTRAIAAAKVKTDKIDALILARLLRMDFLPEVWQPDETTQQLRRSTTERAVLTCDQTRIKNRIHSILHQRLIEPPSGDLFSQKNLDWLAALPLDPQGHEFLQRQLRLLLQLETELEDVVQAQRCTAYHNPQVKLLMTLPGVDFTVAETVLAALGDITRFPSADKAAAYLGLVPSTHQSGENCYHGRITKQGNSHARWMLTEAAQTACNHPGPLGAFFRKLSKRKNRNIAITAVARKLVSIAWHMLKNNEPYRYAIPSTLDAKFDRMRIAVTGKRKRGGNPKGAPRPASYGSGNSTRAIHSIDKVMADNDLPPVAGAKPGESKFLEEKGLTGFAATIHQERRVPRKESPKRPRTASPAPRK